jgi:hypothetical protein
LNNGGKDKVSQHCTVEGTAEFTITETGPAQPWAKLYLPAKGY